MGIRDLYKSSLKKKTSEEIFDLIIYRPLGFIAAYYLRNTKTRPNHITMLSITLGIVSGVSYFYSYEIGAIILIIVNILDCTDGQLARLKKESSLIGMVLDGFGDYTTYTAVYFGAGFALISETGNFIYFFIGWAAAFSTSIQAGIFDDYRNRYLNHISVEEMEYNHKKYKKLLKGTANPFMKFFYLTYVIYTKKQLNLRKKKPSLIISDLFIRLLSFVGSTTHITLLVIFSFLHRIDIYFILIATVFNLYLFILFLFINSLNRTKEESVAGSHISSGDGKQTKTLDE